MGGNEGGCGGGDGLGGDEGGNGGGEGGGGSAALRSASRKDLSAGRSPLIVRVAIATHEPEK